MKEISGITESTGTTGPTLALVAHDGRKHDLLRLVRANRGTLAGCRLLATRATGQAVSEEAPFPIELLEGGPLGGDLQIAGRVVDGRVQAVIFLRDPLTPHPYEPDPHTLLKVCDLHDVPMATNAGSAALILRWLASLVLPPTESVR